jgi:hypothetical protein
MADPTGPRGLFGECLSLRTLGSAPGIARLRIRGDAFPVDSAALRYADRKPMHSAIYDPGAGVPRLRVGDFDAVVKVSSRIQLHHKHLRSVLFLPQPHRQRAVHRRIARSQHNFAAPYAASTASSLCAFVFSRNTPRRTPNHAAAPAAENR